MDVSNVFAIVAHWQVAECSANMVFDETKTDVKFAIVIGHQLQKTFNVTKYEFRNAEILFDCWYPFFVLLNREFHAKVHEFVIWNYNCAK